MVAMKENESELPHKVLENFKINLPSGPTYPSITRYVVWSEDSKLLESPEGEIDKCDNSEGSVAPSTSKKSAVVSREEILSAIDAIYDNSDFIKRNVFELLSSRREDCDLQNELVDLLGPTQLDLAAKILSSRKILASDYVETSNESAQTVALESLMTRELKPSKQPDYCQQITIRSASYDAQKKIERRERKKIAKQFNKVTQNMDEEDRILLEKMKEDVIKDRAKESNASQWVAGLRAQQYGNQKPRYPYVYTASYDIEDSEPLGWQILQSMDCDVPIDMPREMKHKVYETYMEFQFPSVESIRIENLKQIKIDDLDEFGQKCFQGIEKLNIVQSLVFEKAYKTNDNLLICAPTGAGKTNIAMLTILNTVHGFTHAGIIDKDEFKVIYIAPMKALAAEITANFAARLAPLGLKVRELTGDTMLTRKEMAETQMLVLTPEKWDVVTRKTTTDTLLTKSVRLLIIDEVHLLEDDRGAVIEAIVARMLRQVEMNQEAIRIVGLSATLPNYIDVAHFLRVNPNKGLFFFDRRFRPVPLDQTLIGVKEKFHPKGHDTYKHMNVICYQKVHEFVSQGHQVLVFVTARNATVTLSNYLREQASIRGELGDFLPKDRLSAGYMSFVKSARSLSCPSSVDSGFGIHHAGLPRKLRLLMQHAFASGYVSVLTCTATLAWGVNLPAHAVVIRGTEIFNSQQGRFVDMGVLDVQQIFGRAGRPQYDKSGHGVIITWAKSLPRYLRMMSRKEPIESRFTDHLLDNLNAEIASGTVTSISEAVEWLSYTYFYVRVKLNPLAYGVDLEKAAINSEFLRRLLIDRAVKLDRNEMIRFDMRNEYMMSTDLGRIASKYYVKFETIEKFMKDEVAKVESFMTDDKILFLISSASEFKELKPRDSEMRELYEIERSSPLRLSHSVLSVQGKVFYLFQAHISRIFLHEFSLQSELFYVQKNGSRLCRALFEIVLMKRWSQAANGTLAMAKTLDKQVWCFETPLRQLDVFLRMETIDKIERRNLAFYQLRDMQPKELGSMFSCDGSKLHDAIHMLPVMAASAEVKPLTNTIIQVIVTLTPDFFWNDRFLGKTGVQVFWIFIEDINENLIIHHDQVVVNKKKVRFRQPERLIFTLPVLDRQLSHNFQVRVSSDRYVVEDYVVPISMHNCVLPSSHCPPTELLLLDPLPLSALHNETYESIYKFKFFNPIQTQFTQLIKVFHCLYNTDQNALVGAPTGSGKTLCAELAIYRIFEKQPEKKCVYIAPLKALVAERVRDWEEKFKNRLRVKIVELTGDHTPSIKSLEAANIVITTPEKWDGITRSWETRQYVKDVALVIIDEIHLLGVERGAVLEAIITRIKLMSSRAIERPPVRVIGLSTALANAGDIAEWLGVKESGLFNFRPNVRPIPIEVHISGFPGQHYCPRMAQMNKPAFKAIKSYSPLKPSLVFVASRRQTRLTAISFISHLVNEDDPRQWLHMDIEELEGLLLTVKDENLKLTLPFGIGIHHAGLQQHERSVVEQLFVEKKIQVLVATATLAWGINMPAHLVIVKGTEYYDGKTHKYIDFPVTDVLQMIGRAGRPQFDQSAVAVIYVHDMKKNFYKRFLYEPFPVESSMLGMLANHVNAEICSGVISSKQQIMEYIAETYLYRRLFANPGYYGVLDITPQGLTQYLVDVVDGCVEELRLSGCVYYDDEDDQTLVSGLLGQIASIYYLCHTTVRFLAKALKPNLAIEELLKVLADCPEFEEVPVRHNEDEFNSNLQRSLPVKLPADAAMDCSHTKTFLLLQAYLSKVRLPTDYLTDLRSVLSQCIRILQAMFDVSVLRGYLFTTISIVILMQMITQATWHTAHPLSVIPYFSDDVIDRIAPDSTVPMLQNEFEFDGPEVEKKSRNAVKKIMEMTILDERQAQKAVDTLLRWPIMQPKWCTMSSMGISHNMILLQDERWPIYTAVQGDIEYWLTLYVEMLGPYKFETEAVCPHFSREKTAGWIVIIVEKDTGDILNCKRIPPVLGLRQLRIAFRMPSRIGRHILTICILSDAYIGIDQEYNLHCEVVELQGKE